MTFLLLLMTSLYCLTSIWIGELSWFEEKTIYVAFIRLSLVVRLDVMHELRLTTPMMLEMLCHTQFNLPHLCSCFLRYEIFIVISLLVYFFCVMLMSSGLFRSLRIDRIWHVIWGVLSWSKMDVMTLLLSHQDKSA